MNLSTCYLYVRTPVFKYLLLNLFILIGGSAFGEGSSFPKSSFNEKDALAVSQGAIGHVIGDYSLVRSDGTTISTSEFMGKPVIFSLIYTSCYHICPTTTQHLAKVVRKARKVLGQDSFGVVTLGFDFLNDSPDAMRIFSAQQKIDDSGWVFASASESTVARLAEDLGFLYFPSPNGFDHLIQATIVDAEGEVRSQVYDMNFDTPLLVEPIKKLVFGSDQGAPLITQISNKIRLFCTVYDPVNDSYRTDYSVFIGMIIGLTTLSAIMYLVIREWRKQKQTDF